MSVARAPDAQEKPLRIIELRVENVKRVVAVTVRPDGSLILVGGDNAAGKSSTLDAIMYALAGQDTHPKEVIRRGADKALVRVNLGDLIVTRTWTEKGSYLKVTSADGAVYPSPQSMLDALYSRSGMDPLAFMRKRPAEQAEELRALVGLDTSDLDEERARVYAARTDVNRDGKNLRAQVDALPPIAEDVPGEEQSSAPILDELEQAEATNRQNNTRRQEARAVRDLAANAVALASTAETAVRNAKEDLARAQARLDAAEQEAKKRNATAAQVSEKARKIEDEAAALQDVDLEPIRQRLCDLEGVNLRVRQNVTRRRMEQALQDKRDESAGLTSKIEALDRDKAALIAAAKMPVEKLGLSDEGVVTFDGIALSEASSAEQLRVSMAMALAASPRLPVVLIRDGSLLDTKGRALVAQMAEAAGAQVFMEVVQKGEDCAVVIEDGAVKGAVKTAETEAA